MYTYVHIQHVDSCCSMVETNTLSWSNNPSVKNKYFFKKKAPFSSSNHPLTLPAFLCPEFPNHHRSSENFPSSPLPIALPPAAIRPHSSLQKSGSPCWRLPSCSWEDQGLCITQLTLTPHRREVGKPLAVCKRNSRGDSQEWTVHLFVPVCSSGQFAWFPQCFSSPVLTDALFCTSRHPYTTPASRPSNQGPLCGLH